MNEFFALLFSAALTNNVVLTYHVGLDLQTAASRRLDVAWLVGLSTVWCLTLCLPAIHTAEQFIITTLQLHYLDWLLYIAIIILVVLASARLIPLLFPSLHHYAANLTPVLLMNSTLFAVALLDDSGTFTNALLKGFFTGIGFLLLLLALTCLRERVDNQDVPAPFQGLPIFLITLSIISMGLMGLPTP